MLAHLPIVDPKNFSVTSDDTSTSAYHIIVDKLRSTTKDRILTRFAAIIACKDREFISISFFDPVERNPDQNLYQSD